jgi:hypothetical protein
MIMEKIEEHERSGGPSSDYDPVAACSVDGNLMFLPL